DEKAARHAARLSIAAVRQFDTVRFVREKHEHVAVGRVQRRVFFRDFDTLAELARHGPLAGYAVAKLAYKRAGNVRVPYAPVIDAGGRSDFAATVLACQNAYAFRVTFFQPPVYAIRRDGSRELAEIASGRAGQRGKLPEAPMRRRIR